MQIKTEIENEFRHEISFSTLRFKSSELESKYSQYKISNKNVPKWTRMLIISLIIIVIVRRIEVLLLKIFIPEYKSTYGTVHTEIVNIGALTIGMVCEIFVFFCRRISFIRGFIISISIFFSVSYAAHTNFTQFPAINN